MIQRFLYDILKNGIAAIEAEPDLLDDIFSQYNLATSEVEDIKTWFTAKVPGVKHQYARVDDTFPLMAIVMSSERESDLFIGNDGLMVEVDGSGYIGSDDEDFGNDLKASIWQVSYQIHCVSEHPDGTLYLYEIAKAILLTADLDACGLHTTQFSGMDLNPLSMMMPSHLFGRIFDIQGKTEFERIVQNSTAKAFRLGGVHIDKEGSPSDPGAVKTLITVVVPTE